MIFISVNLDNLRHLRAIFPDMTVAIDHYTQYAIRNTQYAIRNTQYAIRDYVIGDD